MYPSGLKLIAIFVSSVSCLTPWMTGMILFEPQAEGEVDPGLVLTLDEESFDDVPVSRRGFESDGVVVVVRDAGRDCTTRTVRLQLVARGESSTSGDFGGSEH